MPWPRGSGRQGKTRAEFVILPLTVLVVSAKSLEKIVHLYGENALTSSICIAS